MIKLEQYRDIWLAEKFNEFIGFFPREFHVLDNFASFGFIYNLRIIVKRQNEVLAFDSNSADFKKSGGRMTARSAKVWNKFRFFYKNKFYPTVEHAYQASKFVKTSPKIAKQILKAFSPHDAKNIAIINKDKQDPKFDEYKIDLMEKLLRLKLEQNPYVKEKLLQTKNYLICEDSPEDSFWGIGKNRDGKNTLGQLWMKLRDELILQK